MTSSSWSTLVLDDEIKRNCEGARTVYVTEGLFYQLKNGLKEFEGITYNYVLYELYCQFYSNVKKGIKAPIYINIASLVHTNKERIGVKIINMTRIGKALVIFLE